MLFLLLYYNFFKLFHNFLNFFFLMIFLFEMTVTIQAWIFQQDNIIGRARLRKSNWTFKSFFTVYIFQLHSNLSTNFNNMKSDFNKLFTQPTNASLIKGTPNLWNNSFLSAFATIQKIDTIFFFKFNLFYLI